MQGYWSYKNSMSKQFVFLRPPRFKVLLDWKLIIYY